MDNAIEPKNKLSLFMLSLLFYITKVIWGFTQYMANLFPKNPVKTVYVDNATGNSVRNWEAILEESANLNRMSTVTTDAIGSENISVDGQAYFASFKFDLTELEMLERELEHNEKIALVFLLYDDPVIALQHSHLLKQGSRKKVIFEWAIFEKANNKRWQDKLLEALTIIQNYCLLRKLGYSREECDTRFLPFRISHSLFINPIKKCLYRLFEDLDKKETSQFLKCIREDFERKHLEFQDYGEDLEIYVLHWQTVNYISLENVGNIKKVVKALGKEEFYDCMNTFSPDLHRGTYTPRQLNIDKTIASEPSSLSSESSSLSIASSAVIPDDMKYSIDNNYPGYCLIINQQSFYKEFSEERKHLVRDLETSLEEREGTQKDEESLKYTFGTVCGMKIVVRNNRTDLEMLADIENAVDEAKKYSTFFVCILSHGKEGEVYGCNCISVKIEEIKTKMCCLKKKPKVLILQACQGTVLAPVENEENLTTDGPGTSKIGKINYADLIVFYATGPGYGAVRDTKNGSWFIQALCRQINEHDSLNFAYISVYVRQEVQQKKWKDGGMISLVEDTFTKFLFLPKFK